MKHSITGPVGTYEEAVETYEKTRPAHYAEMDVRLQSVNIITHYGLGFELGNAVKYVLRAGKKPGETELDDLRKARWYINRRLHLIDSANEPDPVDGPVTG